MHSGGVVRATPSRKPGGRSSSARRRQLRARAARPARSPRTACRRRSGVPALGHAEVTIRAARGLHSASDRAEPSRSSGPRRLEVGPRGRGVAGAAPAGELRAEVRGERPDATSSATAGAGAARPLRRTGSAVGIRSSSAWNVCSGAATGSEHRAGEQVDEHADEVVEVLLLLGGRGAAERGAAGRPARDGRDGVDLRHLRLDRDAQPVGGVGELARRGALVRCLGSGGAAGAPRSPARRARSDRPASWARRHRTRGGGGRPSRVALGGGEPERAAHARAAQAAVAVRDLGEVLLVVVLGVVERAGARRDLRGDLAVAGRGQARLERVARWPRPRPLRVAAT